MRSTSCDVSATALSMGHPRMAVRIGYSGMHGNVEVKPKEAELPMGAWQILQRACSVKASATVDVQPMVSIAWKTVTETVAVDVRTSVSPGVGVWQEHQAVEVAIVGRDQVRPRAGRNGRGGVREWVERSRKTSAAVSRFGMHQQKTGYK